MRATATAEVGTLTRRALTPAPLPHGERGSERPAWRQALIDENMHLVRCTASRLGRYAPAGLEAADYVGAGYIGLAKAADQFDPGRGVKFVTLAIALIRGAILEQARSWDFVPRGARDKEKAGLARCLRTVSLDTRASGLSTSEELTLLDILQDGAPSPGDQAASSLFVDAVRAALQRLPVRERYVFEEHFAGRTFKEIARDLEISESRTFQLNQEASERLRGHLRREMV